MWLSRPLYESIPLAGIIAGIFALLGAPWAMGWIWSEILAVGGVLSLVAGLVLILRRRGYRASRSRLKFDDSQ